MTNGNFDQITSSETDEEPPDLPPNSIPTLGPSPTNTPLPPCDLAILEPFLLTTDTQITVIADAGTPVILFDTGLDANQGRGAR